MKKLIAILLVAGALSCHKNEQLTIDPDPRLGPVQEAEGTLSDYHSVDGCSLLFSIERSTTSTDDYGVSDLSMTLIKEHLVYMNAVANVKVRVRLQQTGQKKDVLCGFAGPKPFDEVIILSIKPR